MRDDQVLGIVLGIEASGTRWVTSLVTSHPAIGAVIHRTYPLDADGRAVGLPLYISMTPSPIPPSRSIVFVVSRDRHCSEASRMAREMIHGAEDRARGWREMFADLAAWGAGRICFASYEALVDVGGREYFTLLLEGVGLNPARMDWANFRPVDGNRKYFALEESRRTV